MVLLRKRATVFSNTQNVLLKRSKLYTCKGKPYKILKQCKRESITTVSVPFSATSCSFQMKDKSICSYRWLKYMRTNGSKFASQNKTFKVLIYTIILMSYFAADSLQIIREKMQKSRSLWCTFIHCRNWLFIILLSKATYSRKTGSNFAAIQWQNSATRASQ